MLFSRLRCALADLIAPESMRHIAQLEKEQRALWSDLDTIFHAMRPTSPTRLAIGWALMRAGYFSEDEEGIHALMPHNLIFIVRGMEENTGSITPSIKDEGDG